MSEDFFTQQRLTVFIPQNQHANMDSLPFRYGVHFTENTDIELFNCENYKWQNYPTKFEVEANFIGNDKKEEKGKFILLDLGGKNPKVATVMRNDTEAEFFLSKLIKSYREAGKVTPADLLTWHPLYLRGEANTFEKLAELYIREKSDANLSDLVSKARNAAALEYKVLIREKDEMRRMKDDAEAKASRFKGIAKSAVDGLQGAEKTIKSQFEKISNLSEDNNELEEEVEQEKRTRIDVETNLKQTKLKYEEAREMIKNMSKQHPQYDGSDVEISTVARLSGVEIKQRTKGNGETVDCVYLSFDDLDTERKMDEIFDPQNLIVNKAKDLIGEMVVTTTWKPEIFKATHWFRDIFLWDIGSSDEQTSDTLKIDAKTDVKTYLNCPFSEKDECKALGGKWDPSVKKWYVSEELNVNDFSKWLP